MSASREYVYSRAEAKSQKTPFNAAGDARLDPIEAAMADACPGEMRELLDGVPGMPRAGGGLAPTCMGHRNMAFHRWFLFNACVARPLNAKERLATPAVPAAMKKEWRRLRAQNVWAESGVRECSRVARGATDAGSKAHVGMLCGICVEKNSELKAGDQRRKFKERVVFQGSRVKEQNYDVAIFQDLT